jgi:cell division transport system ATP-binding protein
MLEATRVTKIYNTGHNVIPVIRNANFKVNSGEFIFLTGPSGAGKTTLMKMLILQEYPTKGDIMFENIKVNELPQKLVPMYRRTLGVVFQDYKLLEHKTVYENIAFVLEILNKQQQEIRDTVSKLLELVNLKNKEDIFPRQLSGGEKRRVVIARAIANNPKLLIADEPTGDLDPENTARIMELLLKINKSGTSVIMTTHNMEILEKYNTFKRWHLEAGELTDSTITKKANNFDKKLQELLRPELYQKIAVIGADSKDDILELTPSFLKNNLKLTEKDITELIHHIKQF